MSSPSQLIIDTLGQRHTYPLPESGKALTIGRDASCDITLDDQRLSRAHASVRVQAGGVEIEDLDSSNGTMVNGVPIFGRRELKSGDSIEFGDSKMWLDQAPSEVTPAPKQSPAMIARRAKSARDGNQLQTEPAALASKGSSSNSTMLLAAAAVAVLGIGGFLVFGPGDDDTEKTSSSSTTAEGAQTAGQASQPLVGDVADGGETTTQKLPPATRAPVDHRQEFETALFDERFKDAARLLNRMPPQIAGSSKPRLNLAMKAFVENVQKQLPERQRREGNAAALKWLKLQQKAVPSSSEAATSIVAMILEIPAAKRPVVAKAPIPSDDGDPAPSTNPKPSAPTAAKPAPKKPEPKEPVIAASRRTELEKAITDAEVALSEHRMDEAEAALARAESTLGKDAGPSRWRRRISRGRRSVAAHRRFIKHIVSSVSSDPSSVGRIPHLSGKPTKVLSIDEEAVAFAGSDAVRLPWRLVPLRTLKALVKKTKFPPSELVNAVVVLRSYGAEKEVESLLARAFRKDQTLKPAIDQVLADGRRMPVPEGGFTLLEDKWYSPRALARKNLSERIDKAVAQLASEKANERDDAYATMRALGTVAQSQLHRALITRKAEIKDRINNAPAFKGLSAVAKLHNDLRAKRESALELIYDIEKYPYPYRAPGASAQAQANYVQYKPIVNQRVAAVREVWTNEISSKVPDSLFSYVAEIEILNERIVEVGFGETTADPPGWVMALPAPGERLSLRNFATDRMDRQRLSQSAQVMAANETDHRGAVATEVEQCRVTNEYRLMMGRHAVRLYDRLIVASHGHCADMSRIGFFAHESPVPGKRSVPDRLALAGMQPIGASENIAINRSPLGAHKAWCQSPGHHRNLLGKAWRIMGPGHVGKYWCQNFAVRDGNAPTDEDEK